MDVAELQKLTDWLIDGGRSATSPKSFMAECCERMVAAGLPLWRHLDPEAEVLPLPEIQIFGCGAHAGRRIDIQDLMVMVPSAPISSSPRRS